MLQEKYEVVIELFHGFDYSKFFTGKPGEHIGVLSAAMDFILAEPAPAKKDVKHAKANGHKLQSRKERYMQAVIELSKAYALVSTHENAVAIREEVAFFQCIRAQLAKMTPTEGSRTSSIQRSARLSPVPSRPMT